MNFFAIKKEKMLISALIVFYLMILGYYVAGNWQQTVDGVPQETMAGHTEEEEQKDKQESAQTEDSESENGGSKGKGGQVILYDSTGETFVNMRLTRDYERAQILDELRMTMASSVVTAEEIAKAKSSYDDIIDTANIEDQIEEKIMALGFADCVYMQTGSRAQIVVQSEEVTPAQYLQIVDTVGQLTGLEHKNIEVSFYQ